MHHAAGLAYKWILLRMCFEISRRVAEIACEQDKNSRYEGNFWETLAKQNERIWWLGEQLQAMSKDLDEFDANVVVMKTLLEEWINSDQRNRIWQDGNRMSKSCGTKSCRVTTMR